jgi:fructose-1,6-bisphosphatase-3
MLDDGAFAAFEEPGGPFTTRGMMDRLEQLARRGYFGRDPEKKSYGLDILWYLWTGPRSPLFGKNRMATFERYFLADRATHHEEMNPYYQYRDQEETARRIMAAFDLDPDRGHIINGHVPVKVVRGESPVKAGGRLLVIDGGFAKAYQEKTGLAGYTLVFNSYGLLLVSHTPFESTQKAIEEGLDMLSQPAILETAVRRLRVEDTDEGRKIREQVQELKALVDAYRAGLIKEG